MAMRITTKMMQNTSLRNLNTNKSRQEKLTNQLATGKKIMRPSDDPIIAIRSLKLNGSLDRIE
ncbi:MAG: flagellar hook-associated protein FlgL, partial [Lachnospiraceae bacterium]|nr:flagellar hook-associated protein FlgL [Lachnospiraceae bacterium]